MVARRGSCGAGYSSCYKEIFQIGVSLVSQERGLRENVFQLRVCLQYVEVAEEDVFDGHVVRMIRQTQDRPVSCGWGFLRDESRSPGNGRGLVQRRGDGLRGVSTVEEKGGHEAGLRLEISV